MKRCSTSFFIAAAAKSLQSCPTLCDTIDGSPPGSLSLGFSRQEHWSGLPFVISELQMNATRRYHSTPIRMAKTQKADNPKCFARLWNNRNAYSLLVGMQNFARQLLPKLKTLLPYIVGWIFPLPPNYVEVLTPSTCDVTLFVNRGFANVNKLRWDHTELGASQVSLVVRN